MQPLVRCAALMSKQYGVITRAQALDAGLTRRQIDHLRKTGMWRNLHRGIYASVDSQAGWHQRAMGVCLWAGSGAALSHRSAAYVWRLEGITSSVVEITTQRSIRAAGVLVHRSQDPPKGVVRIAGMPVTSLPVTLLNLSAAVPRYRFEVALDDALRRGLTSIERLQALLDAPTRGRTGVASLTSALHGYETAPCESPLERRFLRLLRSAGLPEPEMQYEVRKAGRVVARLDFAYPDVRLGIEVDGYRWHSGRRQWARDVSRQNELIDLGWRILHVTYEDMADGGARAVERCGEHEIVELCVPDHA